MTGVVAALVFFLLGLVAEGALIPRLRHARQTAAPVAPAKPTQTPLNTDDFQVTTSEVIVSQDSWEDPFLIPASVGVLIVTSALTYRRLRNAPTPK